MGRAPGGMACIADIVPKQKGFETELGGLEIPQGIFTGAGEITNRFIFHRGDIDACEIPRAHQPRQLHGITTVGFHAVAGLLGNEGGRDDPADIAFVRQIAKEPIATGSRFIDEDQVLGFGLQPAHELINVALPSANGAQVDDLSVVSFGDIGHGDGVLVDIQPNIVCVRVLHG
jgi:hypothetical protein